MALMAYLVITDQLNSFLTEFPIPPIFSRIINHLQTLPFELEAQPKILLLVVGGDDHEARSDLRYRPA